MHRTTGSIVMTLEALKTHLGWEESFVLNKPQYVPHPIFQFQFCFINLLQVYLMVLFLHSDIQMFYQLCQLVVINFLKCGMVHLGR